MKLGMQSLEMEKLEKENVGLDEDALDDKQIELENKQEDVFTVESFNIFEGNVFAKMVKREKQVGENLELQPQEQKLVEKTVLIPVNSVENLSVPLDVSPVKVTSLEVVASSPVTVTYRRLRRPCPFHAM